MLFKTLMIFTVVLAATSAQACSCIGTPTTMEAYEGADTVFLGTVTQESLLDGSRMLIFEVERRWKGEWSMSEMVTTAESGGMCGVDFRMGESWVVFAYDDTWPSEEWSWTHLCTLNRTGNEAEEIIWELDAVPTEKNTWGTMKARHR